MTQAFVYRWTHIPTGRWYIGSRTKKGCHIEDGYICSSRLVLPLVQAHPEEWRRDILALGLPQDMRKLETELLKNANAARNPQSFNQSNGLWDPGNRLGGKESAITRERKRKAHTGKKRPDHSRLLTGKKRPLFGLVMKGRQAGEKNARAKSYIVEDPQGNRQEITCLKTFCESLNKPTVTAREMASGEYPNNTARRGAWAGWRITFKSSP